MAEPRTVINIQPNHAVRTLPIPQAGEIVLDREGRRIDRLGRPLRDLRISVTDRCNFRCRYCMPKEKFPKGHEFLGMTELLTFEEIVRLARVFVRHGVEKLRLTGGEPLLRKGIENLIAQLSELRTYDGKPLDIAMTTNGSVLGKKAEALRAAGLTRVTVSLDAIDEAIFQGFNDVGFPASRVLASIEAAQAAGIQVKVNTVVKRGVNEGEILPILEHFRGTGVIPRFIEYMDVGTANGWRMTDVVPAAEIIAKVNERWPVEPLDANYPGETARRWRFKDGGGEFGCIASVTQAFCRECSRARLSMEGRLFLCLFATEGFDLRTMLRGGATDEEIDEALGRIWTAREDHYSELRSMGLAPDRPKVEMNYIGG